jgi:hypothetical protein
MARPRLERSEGATLQFSVDKAKRETAADIFGESRWIWPNRHHWDIANSYALFRKSFQLGALPLQAPLFITADQSYRLFVNGQFVARGPARGVQSHWPYDEIDIRKYLKKGRNVLAIRAYNPGRSTYQYLSAGFAGLLVAASWGKNHIVSDATWKSIRQTSARRDTIQASMQLFNQEHVDLRLETGDWTAVDFDDSSWEEPTSDRVWNSGPWFSLEPREMPMLREEEIPPGKLIGLGQGPCASGYRDVRDVVALRYQEDRSHSATSASAELIKISPVPAGEFRSYLIDLGKTVVGNFTFEIHNCRGGEIIDTHYSETIDQNTLTPDLVLLNHCRNSIGDRLVCRPGDAVHVFYHHYGFRYLTITVRDSAVDFQIGLRFRRVGYPLQRNGSFLSSDSDLNRIWETCAWTQQCCSLDAYVDTPWREQAQWWGDARVQAWNTFHLDGDTRLFRRGIRQIAEQTTPDGLTYGHAPTMAHECVLPDFTLIWMLTIWDFYWQTGSTEPFLSHEAQIQRALAYFRGRVDERTGLITYDERYWLFLDWTDIYREGSSSVYNLWLLLALEKMALLYRKTGQRQKAAALESWAGELRLSLSRLINDRGFLCDGIDRDGELIRKSGIHAQTLALMVNLKGINQKSVISDLLLPFIQGDSAPASKPSAYWITYCFSLLSEMGCGAEIVEFIRKHWLPMADHGTTWEDFQPCRGEQSFSHAWSAHPLYHLMQTVGGITQSAPAWREVIFRPLFHDKSCRTTIPTPHGNIHAHWQKCGDLVEVELVLPEGISARVLLPGVKRHICKGTSRWQISGRKQASHGCK